MAAKTVPSLTDFAATQPRARAVKCAICELPDDVRNQVVTSREENRVSVTLVLAWLRTLGYEDITRNKVNRHFQDAH